MFTFSVQISWRDTAQEPLRFVYVISQKVFQEKYKTIIHCYAPRNTFLIYIAAYFTFTPCVAFHYDALPHKLRLYSAALTARILPRHGGGTILMYGSLYFTALQKYMALSILLLLQGYIYD